jgi:hypothetical protein
MKETHEEVVLLSNELPWGVGWRAHLENDIASYLLALIERIRQSCSALHNRVQANIVQYVTATKVH